MSKIDIHWAFLSIGFNFVSNRERASMSYDNENHGLNIFHMNSDCQIEFFLINNWKTSNNSYTTFVSMVDNPGQRCVAADPKSGIAYSGVTDI